MRITEHLSMVLAYTTLFSVPTSLAVGTPFGQAAGTTGGGNATPAYPSSLAELVSWLGDSTARVNKIWDFTNYEGESVSGTACAPWTCSPNPQISRYQCQQLVRQLSTWSFKVYRLHTTKRVPILSKFASNKSLIGIGSNGGLKRKGLKISGASSIIIQNIKITEINPRFVWGGDTLQIDGGRSGLVTTLSNTFGDKCLSPAMAPVTQTTFSYNVLNGDSTYSATCNVYKNTAPIAASSVSAHVQANAGVGIIN